MNDDLGILVTRMSFLLGQVQEALGHVLARSKAIESPEQQSSVHKTLGSEADSTDGAQYLALEDAIREQRKRELWQQQPPSAGAVQPPLAADISLGASSWRLAMNGWTLMAHEGGFEMQLRPQERLLLLCVGKAPGQFLAPHEVRELNRSLAASSGGGEEAVDLLHTKVIGRLRQRMRTNGHLLPLRASPAGSIYVDGSSDLPRRARRRTGGIKPFHSPKSEKAMGTSHSDIRIAAGETAAA